MGNRDLVENNHNGFIFSTFKDAIGQLEKLIDQADRRKTFGASSKVRCQQFFSKNQMIAGYLDCYDCIGKPHLT